MLLLTCVEQGRIKGMSDAVKQEIQQILQERRIVSRAAASAVDMIKAASAEDGITIGKRGKKFRFETCEEISLSWEPVRLPAS